MKECNRYAHVGLMIYIMRRQALDVLGPVAFHRISRALSQYGKTKMLCPASGWTKESLLDAMAILADSAIYKFRDSTHVINSDAVVTMAACHLFDVLGGAPLADSLIGAVYQKTAEGRGHNQLNLRLGNTDVCITVMEWIA